MIECKAYETRKATLQYVFIKGQQVLHVMEIPIIENPEGFKSSALFRISRLMDKYIKSHLAGGGDKVRINLIDRRLTGSDNWTDVNTIALTIIEGD